MIIKINITISILLSLFLIILSILQLNFNSNIEIFFLLFYFLNFIISIFFLLIKNKLIEILFYNSYILFIFLIIIESLIYTNIITSDYIKFNSNKINSKMVQALDYNPWYKFHSNTIVTTDGFRGSDLNYSWKTDQFGFKNNQIRENYFAIALGDSFTESLGVSIEQSWTNILSENGFSTYNAGVQGYAPSQLYGTLNLLKDKINFKNIFIGHLHQIYFREKIFYNNDKIDKAFGGLESIRQNDLNKPNLFLPILTKYYILELKEYFLSINSKEINELNLNRFQEYKNEIKFIKNVNNIIEASKKLDESNYWQRAIEHYRLIIEFAKENNKNVYFVFFPTRPEIYFSKKELNISELEQLYYYIEMNNIKEKFVEKNVFFIDPFDKFKNSIIQNEKLPFFKTDGHMSVYGNNILANTILEYLENN